MTGERLRCTACGNLTRFDLTVTRTMKEYHHFSVGGDVEVESIEILEENVEEILCRWCGSSSAVERFDGED